MMFRNLFIALALLSHIFGSAHAVERPWGVITPFGSVASEQSGFQGRYNPWESKAAERAIDPQTEMKKWIKPGWQNIYSPRTIVEKEIWPDTKKSPGKGRDGSQKRVFGDKGLTGEERWPERKSRREPYRSSDRFWPPPDAVTPNIPLQPFFSYGNSYPGWQRY